MNDTMNTNSDNSFVAPETVSGQEQEVQAVAGDTQQKIESLENKLHTCQEERHEFEAKFLRATADFHNFKKRVEKEQVQWTYAAQADILLPLLSIVDDFDRAFAEVKQIDLSDSQKGWFVGIEMIYKALQKLLTQCSVEEIRKTDQFDSTYHEALMQIDSPDHASGAIVSILQKGYLFKGNVLRPAKVSVAK